MLSLCVIFPHMEGEKPHHIEERLNEAKIDTMLCPPISSFVAAPKQHEDGTNGFARLDSNYRSPCNSPTNGFASNTDSPLPVPVMVICGSRTMCPTVSHASRLFVYEEVRSEPSFNADVSATPDVTNESTAMATVVLR